MKQTEYLQVKQLGIVLDLPPEVVRPDQFTSGQNITFRDECGARVEGYARYAAPILGNGPIYAASVPAGGINWWIYMTTTQVFVTDGFTHTDITPDGGLVPCSLGDWTFTSLNGIPVFNNPQNKPMYWALNPANKAQFLPGWPDDATCKAMRAIKFHLVALNITQAGQVLPQQVWWSEGAQAGAIPQEWIPSATNDAGDTILADSIGPIVDAWPLRDQLIIYKENSTFLMQYVAGQYVYAFRKIFPTVGMPANNCVAEIGGEHWVFTGQDVIRHDGQNYASVVDQKVKRALVQSVDPGQVQLCCVVARIVDQQVWVCIPEGGGERLTKAYVINVADENIGMRDLPNVASVSRGVVNPSDELGSWQDNPFTWEQIPGQWNEALFSPTADSLMMTGYSQNKLYSVGNNSSADGEPIPAYLERLSGMIGDFATHKVVTRLVPRIEGSPGDVINIRMGSQNFFDEPISWGEIQPFTIGTDVAVQSIIDGRYLSVNFSGNTIAPWSLYSYTIKYANCGEY